MLARRPLLALLLLSSLAAVPALAAETVVGTGRYAEDALPAVVWQPKVLPGAAVVAQVVAQDGPVKAGDKMLMLTVEGVDEVLADTRRAVAKAERAVRFEQAEAVAQTKELAAAKARAVAQAEAAKGLRQRWQEAERANALAEAARQVENLEAQFKDSSEELRQLEKMYKEARIDSSTQDLVVGREQRKLRKIEKDLDLQRRRTAYYAKVELVQKDAEFERAETEAALRLGAEERRAAREEARVGDALEQAEKNLKQAQKKLVELEADVAALAVAVPADGRLSLALKAGDQVKGGQELAKLLAPAGGSVKIEVQPAGLVGLPVDTQVKLRFVETGVTVPGKVVAVDWAGQPEGAKTLFSVRVRPLPADFVARSGLKVEVVK